MLPLSHSIITREFVLCQLRCSWTHSLANLIDICRHAWAVVLADRCRGYWLCAYGPSRFATVREQKKRTPRHFCIFSCLSAFAKLKTHVTLMVFFPPILWVKHTASTFRFTFRKARSNHRAHYHDWYYHNATIAWRFDEWARCPISRYAMHDRFILWMTPKNGSFEKRMSRTVF